MSSRGDVTVGAVHAQAFVDVEARAAASPRTFEIPPREARAGLRVGDFGKVVFVLAAPDAGGPSGERMWLEVLEVLAPGEYRGALANDPVDFPEWAEGDEFFFAAEHVCGIEPRETYENQ